MNCVLSQTFEALLCFRYSHFTDKEIEAQVSKQWNLYTRHVSAEPESSPIPSGGGIWFPSEVSGSPGNCELWPKGCCQVVRQSLPRIKFSKYPTILSTTYLKRPGTKILSTSVSASVKGAHTGSRDTRRKIARQNQRDAPRGENHVEPGWPYAVAGTPQGQ